MPHETALSGDSPSRACSVSSLQGVDGGGFQIFLPCSDSPRFISFVSVTTFLVSLEALICSLLFSKKLSAVPHGDKAVPAFISGLPTIQ
jgi:hypothetical protein